MRVARRLRETVIEATDARTRDVDQQAIENLAAVFIGIETLVNKMAQEAARLRNAQRVSPLRASHRGRIVFEIRDEVAYSRQAQSNHYWIFDYVY